MERKDQEVLKMSEKKPHTIWLTDEVWYAIQKIADAEGLTISDVLARLTIGLEKYGYKEQVEALRKEQDAKKEEIRRTLKKLIAVIPSWLNYKDAEVYYCSRCDRLELYASYNIAVRNCKVCYSQLASIGVLADWL
jgi:predicted CopG family antitoxin